MGSGQHSWNVQIPDHNEKCPVCVSVLEDVWGSIGGFPGHEHTHLGPLVGYKCPKCKNYFTLKEYSLLWKRRDRRKEFFRNYWEGVRTGFKSPYLYLITVCFMVLYKSFWVGIAAFVIFPFLMPIMVSGLEITFTPVGRLVGRLVRKILPPNKPPDNPKTP